MVNKLLQGITAGAAVLTLGTSAVRAGELPVPPSPTNPNDNSATTLVVPVSTKAASLPSSFPSPTNPNPPPDQRSLVRTLFIAQTPKQIAQGDEQPSNTSSNKRPAESNNDTQVVNRQLEQSRQAQIESAQNLRNRKPVPGGE
jgi:hypothetical protein